MENKALERQLKKEAKAVGLTYAEYTDILTAEIEAEETLSVSQMLGEISMLNVSFC